MSSRKAQKSKSNLSGGKSGKGKASDAADSVKVAVRVRPFNSREKAGNQECIVEMNGTTTIIKDQSGNKPVRNFTFDYSYWSHDGYEEKEDGVYQGTNDQYASQRKVFDDLGEGMLDNAWNGYNAALFAYGQTGSGKSYTMVGYNQNKGIVPMMCEELFRRIEREKSSKTEFQITFSMLEIYNEKVRDLLARKNVPGGLKIRQNKKDGFFVFGLTKNAVSSAEDALKWMEQGNYARTTAATAMNETSSRSHMVITLAVKQVRNKGSSDSTTVTSDIHMVDLAGSERAESAGTSTDRLQEGSAINQSLSCLGNVISALADLSAGRPNVRVPYRDSVLTKLLQNALGGNSRTIMISAISPSQMNYEETISTLRYADRAKQIKCKAVINENPTEKLIRELKEENARLMEMLSQGTLPSGKGQDAHKDLIEENKLRLQHMDMNWADQLAKAESSRSPGPGRYHRSKSEKDCHLVNINEDPLLSGVIRHVIKEGKTLIGRETDDGHEAVPSGYENCTRLGGLSILAEHATLTRSGNEVKLEPMANAQVIVNGKRLLKTTTLQHHDRIVLAPNHLYKYVAHREQRKKDKRTIDFNFVQLEIAAAQGLTSLAGVGTSTCLVNPDLQQVRQDLIELLPMVAEANAISKELEKNVVFDVIVKNGASHNLTDKSKSVMVKVTDRNTNYVWLWEKSTFINRKYLMQELYELWVDGETLDQDQSKDPFWDPPEDMFLGSVYIYLQSLSYQFDIEETMSITNYKGEEEGKLHVGISPCDCTGLANSEKDTPPMFVDNPQQQLLGSRMDLLVKIPYSRNVRWIQEDVSRGISCQFKFYTDTKMRTTKTVLHEDNPNFDYTKQFTIKSVSHNFLNYLEHNALVVEVWGKQGNGRPKGGIPMSLGSGSKVDDASMDNVLSETQWRTERIQLLQQLSDLKKEVEFLRIEKGVLEKEMTRITLASETFMQTAEGLLPGEGPGQDLPSMVQGFLKEDHVLRERLDELSSGEYRPSKSELKSVKQACDNQQKEVGRIEKELSSIVKAARAVTDAVAKKPTK